MITEQEIIRIVNEIDGDDTSGLTEEQRADQIYNELIKKDVPSVVARDWANEPRRRRRIQQAASRRKARKESRGRGPKGSYGRDIIREYEDGSHVHATKGRRFTRARDREEAKSK